MAEPLDPVRLAALRADLVARVVADAAHELRNPLNALVINLAVLRSRVTAGDRDGALGRIDVLESEVRRVHGILERLVALLRPPRDTDDPADAGEALDDVLPLVTLHAAARRIVVVPAGSPDGLAVAIPRATLRYIVLDAAMAVLERIVEGGRLDVAVEAEPPAIRVRGTPPDGAGKSPEAPLAQLLLEAAAGSAGPDPDAPVDAVSLRLELPARA